MIYMDALHISDMRVTQPSMISFVKRKKLPLRARRSAKKENFDSLSVCCMPLGKIPAIRRTIHPFAASSNG
jgi:hypothetical protein